MKKLITNSDDFGLTDSITDAIIDTHLNGIMTSTTMMANMNGFDYAVLKAKEYPSLGVGIHFNLTEGSPITEISKIPDLVNDMGQFKCNKEQRKNLIFGKTMLIQKVGFIGSYPHNLIVEAFMAIGFFGGIMFLIYIAKCIRFTIRIIKNNFEDAWIPLLFLQYLTFGMFSGNLFVSYSFWSISVLLLGTSHIKQNNSSV